MGKKTAIITGASSGFGLLSSIELAKSGFFVVATMRDMNKKQELLALAKELSIEESIEVYKLDVTSAESIKNFKDYLSGLPSVDVLLNNAGYAAAGFCEELELHTYKEQFETNFFGVISVTQAVLPYMRKQKSGRIINMSSISGRFGFPGLSPYTSSKFALEGFSESLRLEVQPFGIDVSLIEPGSFSTNIWSREAVQSEKLLNHDSAYYFYIKRIVEALEKGKAHHEDPIEVAKLVAKIASDSSPSSFRYPIGKGVKMNIMMKNIIPWNWLEKMVLKRLLGRK